MRPSSSIGRAWALTYVALAIAVTGGLVLTVVAAAIAYLGPFDGFFVVGSLAPYVAGTVIIVARISAYHPYPRFGAANVVTLIRLMIAGLFAGLAVQVVVAHVPVSPGLAWFFLSLAVLGLVLDGIDGYAARKQGLESPFGSRFDMETDALQILLLAIAVFELQKAGAWVLIGGVLRYLYVVAGMIWPVLNGPLRPAWRRKIISVVQGGTLAALLAPIIVPPLSVYAAAVALILLIYSFAVDVIWLLRSPRRAAA
jgi:phosphatidylglycerophosphate synthase